MAPKRKKEQPHQVDGAMQPPQVNQPPVPDPPPSSPAVIGPSSADRNQPSSLGAQHRLPQGSTGRSHRGRSVHPYSSSGRGRRTQPPPNTSPPPPPPPHPSPLHRTAQQHHLVSPHISPTTTSSPNTPSSLGTPQQPRRVTRASPATTSPSSSLQTPQHLQPDSSSCPVGGSLWAPQVELPPVPVPPPSSPAVIGSSSAEQNQPSPLGAQHQLPQGSTGRSPRGSSPGGHSFHPYSSSGRGRGTQLPPNTSPPPPLPPHPSRLHRTAHQQNLVSPHTSPTTTTSPNTPSSLGTPQQPRRVTRTSPATTSPSSSLQTPQQHQPNSSSCSPLQDHTVSSGKTSVARSPSAWAKPLPHLIKPTTTPLANSFLEILKNFTLAGENCPLYKAQVISLVMRGSSVLVVDFEHLLTNIDLAVKVANESGSSYLWLASAVRAFFSEECSEMKIEGMQNFIEGACVSFSNMPSKFFSLTDFKAEKAKLVKVLKLIHGQKTCTAASVLGRELFLAILIYVLGRHRARQSWNGNFCEKDVYFFRYPGRLLECRVLKSINPDRCRCTATARKNDLGTVDSIMRPYYEDADGKLPVLFDGLHDDLKNSPPADVVEEWFMNNLEFDLALMPPGARKILVLAVSNAIKSLKLSSLPGYHDILRRRWSDWRGTIRKDKGMLGGVYWFENKERDVAKDQYKHTMESAVGFERNTHEHGHQHLDGEKRLDDFDEGELLIAMKQSEVLRKLVKDLMRLNMMGGPLAAVREIYCKSRAVQNEPATALSVTQSGKP